MNINYCFIIVSFILSVIYAVTEKWISSEASPPTDGQPSAEERAAALSQFKDYYPILLKFWGIYGIHQKVMESAIGCEKFAIVCPFLVTWRLLLLAIGSGFDTEAIKYSVAVNRASEDILSDDNYRKIVELNDLVKTIRGSSNEPDVSHAVELTASLLSSVFFKFIPGASRLSKSTVNELGDSLKSCFLMSVHFKNNKQLLQDFIDAIKKGGKSEDLQNESAGFLSYQKSYFLNISEPTVEELVKIQKINSVMAHTTETSRDNSRNNRTRGSERSLLSRIIGFLSGKEEEDPFKVCTTEYDDYYTGQS